MKRILSLMLTVAFMFAAVAIPASAVENVTVDITSITDGDTFTAGDDIKLSATATGTVTNIDFYANGSKLPGTIVGNSGSITWYDACEGVYEITTTPGNEKVKVVVLPPKDEVVMLWNGDLEKVSLQDGGGKAVAASDQHTVYGAKSVKVVPVSDSKLIFNIDKAYDWDRTAAIVYSPEFEGTCTVAAFYDEIRKGPAGNYVALKKGINFYSTATGVNNSNLDSVVLTFSGENNDKPVYVLGIIGMKSSFYETTIPVATAEIGNNATNISTALGTYRINFDKAILPDDTKAPAIVNTADGDDVEVEYTYGFNYVDLKLPTLTEGTKYVVKIPASTIRAYDTSNLGDYNSNTKYVAETTFNFTTAAEAKPVVKMTYPKAGTYGKISGIAAQVVAPSEAINSVKFYNGSTELGTATKMTDGEYWFAPETDLADGTYSITAKFLDASSTVIAETAAVSYTIKNPDYFVKGIGNGDVIVAAEEPSRKITVVDKADENKLSETATDVQKVEFYNEFNELIGTDEDGAPYDFELVFDNYGEHTLKTVVYNVYGGTKEVTSTYKVVNGVKNSASYSENFTNLTTDNAKTFFAPNGTGAWKVSGSGATTEIVDGALTFTHTAASGTKQFAFKHTTADTGSKVIYYEYNLSVSYSNAYRLVLHSEWPGNGSQDTLLYAKDDNLTENEVYKVGIILDFNTNNDYPTAIIRLNDKEYKRIELASFGSTAGANDVILHNKLSSASSLTIDNFKFAVYDTDTTKAFGTGEYDREYTNLSAGTLNVLTNAINTKDTDETVTNIVAVYGENNVLLRVAYLDNVTYKAGDFGKSKTYPVEIKAGDLKVRVFTLNSLSTLVPVAEYNK